MIKELKLSNFRVFDDEVKVRFRPITVLIGKNNSGKSSIIKFLLMLQQSLSPDNNQFLNPEGEKVQFGNFHALKNSATEKSDLTFQLTVGEHRSGGDVLWCYLNRCEGLEDTNREGELIYATDATVSYERKGQFLKEHNAVLLHDGKEFLPKSRYIPNDDNRSLLDFSSEYKNEKNSTEAETHNIEENYITALRKNISDLRHLLPVRQGGSSRVIVTAQPPSMTAGQRGEYTLPHLQHIMDENDVLRNFLLPHIKTVAGIEEIRFERLPIGSRCWAVNKTTGAEVLIHDFGFGVSQCMPIFVQGAIMHEQTSLMVEEPESHLHPTAQSALGSFFADLWKIRKVGSIIETHSNNILIRLRRLIARGDLAPEDVSIAFFDFEDSKPIIRNLDINEDGSMENGLPMEFFGYHIEDGLYMGAGK